MTGRGIKTLRKPQREERPAGMVRCECGVLVGLDALLEHVEKHRTGASPDAGA